jgi:hypothetical protein
VTAARYCCFIGDGDVHCPNDAVVEVRTQRSGEAIAGPDPFADFTDACIDHVGALLGHQPEMLRPDEVEWLVIPIEAAL